MVNEIATLETDQDYNETKIKENLVQIEEMKVKLKEISENHESEKSKATELESQNRIMSSSKGSEMFELS